MIEILIGIVYFAKIKQEIKHTSIKFIVRNIDIKTCIHDCKVPHIE